jgi:hypothetical protein
MDAAIAVAVLAVAVVGTALCRAGRVMGPILVGLGLAVPGALLVAAGSSPVERAVGVLCLAGSVVELVATTQYSKPRPSGEDPPHPWLAVATLVGIAGVVGAGLPLLYSALVFVAWMVTLP